MDETHLAETVQAPRADFVKQRWRLCKQQDGGSTLPTDCTAWGTAARAGDTEYAMEA